MNIIRILSFFLFLFFLPFQCLATDGMCLLYPDQIPFQGKECINIEQLQWVTEPPEDAPPTSEFEISHSGGQPPYTWYVQGNGFYLDGAGTLKEVKSNSLTAILYLIDACGAATVTLRDACGTKIKINIRSENGRWQLIGSHIGAYTYPVWDELPVSKCTVNGDQLTLEKYDEVSGKFALTYGNNLNPAPSVPRPVTYHAWSAFAGGTCSGQPLGNTFSPDGFGGNFEIQLSTDEVSYGNVLYSSKWISTAVQILEWSCNQ